MDKNKLHKLRNTVCFLVVLVGVTVFLSLMAIGVFGVLLEPKPETYKICFEEVWTKSENQVLMVDFFDCNDNLLETMTPNEALDNNYLSKQQYREGLTLQIRRQFMGGGGELCELKLTNDLFSTTKTDETVFKITEQTFQGNFIAGQYKKSYS